MAPVTTESNLIINARGTYTPLGVSRSSCGVGEAVSLALQDFAVIEDLHDDTSAILTTWAGCEAAAVTHCSAASLTLSVAAAIAGEDPQRIQQLPDTTGLRNAVVIPAAHAVDYGHPLLTDIRLAGGRPVVCGGPESCASQDLAAALAADGVACLVLVSSRLVKGPPSTLTALTEAVSMAHLHGVPAIIDAAAQDWRVVELLGTGADAVLISAQKYLGAPTAGLVLGSRSMVKAVRAQEKGIGRAMKTTKEALVGVQAAVAQRMQIDAAAWRQEQDRKVALLVGLMQQSKMPGVTADSAPDPTGLPFSRVRLQIDTAAAGIDATQLTQVLRQGKPSIWTMDHDAGNGVVWLELIALRDDEIHAIHITLKDAIAKRGGRSHA